MANRDLVMNRFKVGDLFRVKSAFVGYASNTGPPNGYVIKNDIIVLVNFDKTSRLITIFSKDQHKTMSLTEDWFKDVWNLLWLETL